MGIMNRQQNDPTAVDVLSYIDEDVGLSPTTSEADLDSAGLDPFDYEDALNMAIDLRQAIKKIGVPIDDNNINALLEAAGIERLRPDDINHIIALLD